MVSLRHLPDAVRELRKKGKQGAGEISSAQALASVVAATIGLGNIAGVAIALVMGGPGAIFWMWVSAIVGMATKFHEGTLTTMYKGHDDKGRPQGGTMHIIERGFGMKWKPLARFFAIAGMFGTLCIMNSNQLTEATMATFTTPEGIASSQFLSSAGSILGMENASVFKLLFGCAVATVVAVVVIGGIKRIANVATVMVPFMVAVYFVLVMYIIVSHITEVPTVISSIFSEAFNLRAGFGAFAGIAIIGARRAALVNDAGIGTATIMHGASANNQPVREGLFAMLGPSIDSGLVCTLTAMAILLCGDINAYGEYMLMFIVLCFGLSSMFSYSYYGTTCASYLFGSRAGNYYRWAFVLSLIVFAVVPLEAAVGLCDSFYALMAIPTMIAVLSLSGRVRKAAKEYFKENKQIKNI